MNKLRLYLVLMAMLLPLAGWCAVGDEFQSDVSNVPVWFTVTGENTVKVGRLTGSWDNRAIDASSAGSIDLPETVVHDGKIYRITEIGPYAFYNCYKLTSVSIPSSVTTISDYAFYRCRGITSLTILNSVTSIGKRAFDGCSGMTSLTIPNSVTSIGEYAFFNCSGLTSLTIPNSVTSIGDFAFHYCSGLISVTFHCPEIGSWFSHSKSILEINIGKEVTSIGSKAFYMCSSLTSVTIPNNVTSIGESAFYDCSGLSSVTIPNSVTSIGDFAFSGCNVLTSVTIPNSVTSIGERTFFRCRGLTSVTIPNSVTSIGKEAFCYCSSLTSVIIPNSVTSIGEDAFLDCSSLTSMTIPSSVTSIGESTFYGCSGLTSVTIPNSVTLIGESAFHGCSGLTSLTIPNSVTSIGRGALYECTGLTSVVIPNSITRIEDYVFRGCSSLTSVTIPNSVTTISNSAFYGCSGLTSVTIPDGVTSIGDLAFEWCSSLTSLTIPNSVTSIGNNAFSASPYLNDVNSEIKNPFALDCVFPLGSSAILYVPIGCKTLYEATDGWKDHFLEIVERGEEFQSVVSNVPVWFTVTGENTVKVGRKIGSTTNVAIDASTAGTIDLHETVVHNGKEYRITRIGSYAFGECGNLTSVTIPSSVASIDNSAFRGCSSLTSVTIPDGVTSIGYASFQSCSGLTSVTIPNSVTSIGDSAFKGCSNLTSVAIPSSVKTIGASAFYDCTGLTSVVIPNSLIRIEDYTFYGCSGLISVSIPSSVTRIGSSAFQKCSSLTSVTIPNSVASIQNYAFSGCTGLKDVFSEIEDAFYIDATVFSEIGSALVLHVPSGCKSLYKETGGWKDAFSQIVEMGEIVANEVTYEMAEDNTVAVKTAEVNQTTGSVSIPKAVVVNNAALPVTAIAPKAFQNVKSVTSVTIPSSISSIGAYAFAGCTNLRHVLCLNRMPATLLFAYAGARSLLKDGESGSTVSQFDGVNLNGCTLYVLDGSEQSYKDAAGWSSFGTIKPFAGMGDVNTDKAIDVSDVVGEVNQILGKASTGFLYGAGDMNADNSIDVSDVVSIVNVILGKTAGARSMERLSAVAETTASDHLSLMAGNEGGLSLVLDNTADYIAAQFDVRLSEGQTLEKVVKGQRARGHQLATAKMSDGVYRVLLYTIGDRTFSGQSGEVVSLGVAGQGDVTVENITFITAGESRKKFDDLSNQLTGIGAVLNTGGEMTGDAQEWYDLQGHKLETAPTTKGVYLKNGKKVVVK